MFATGVRLGEHGNHAHVPVVLMRLCHSNNHTDGSDEMKEVAECCLARRQRSVE